MANFWKIVIDVIKESDIVVIVADARVPEESVNLEVLDKIKKADKKYVVVFNKEDLLDEKQKKRLEDVMIKYPFAYSVSAKNHAKTMSFLRKLNAIAHGDDVTVGVVGYPNTGKSSIINAIKGRNSAPVSSQAGHTKGVQKLRVTKKVILLDSPGVIPYKNKKQQELQGLLSARSPNQLKDPEGAAMKVLSYLEGKVENFYGVEVIDDFDETLDNIAVKLNLKKSGNVPDQRRASVQILLDWQNGKIR